MKLWHAWAHRLYADGKSVVEISRTLRRSDTGVRYVLDLDGCRERMKAVANARHRALRNKPSPLPSVRNSRRFGRWDNKTIRNICAAKGRKTAQQLASELGVTRNTVMGIWHRHHDRHRAAVRS